MRKIKFRGEDLHTGELVYGDFVHYVPQSSFCGIVDQDGFLHEIKTNSQAQLVGYDKQGREVYQGDVMEFTDTGELLSAEFTPCFADKYRHLYFSGDLISPA